MSTDYAIAKQGSVEFIIDEASNKFDLSIDDIKEDRAVTLTALTPDELVAVAARLLRVASYWCASHKAIREAGKTALDYTNELPPLEPGK